VSQASISRLEREPGSWTPLSTIERVRAALRHTLGPEERRRLRPDVRDVLFGEGGPVDAGDREATAPIPLVADTLLDALARIALRVDGRHRPAFLQVVEAAADAMERPALGRRAS
jgi:hypothetical protein